MHTHTHHTQEDKTMDEPAVAAVVWLRYLDIYLCMHISILPIYILPIKM